MQRLIFIGLIAACFALTTGCGNKGDLYLPSAPAQAQQLPADDESATAEP